MKNTFGNNLTLTLFGESHGEYIGFVLDGITPGVEIDHAAIRDALKKRRPSMSLSTPRIENDDYRIISGEYNGRTTGAPLTLIIPNENTKSADYGDVLRKVRPSHADFTAEMKYHGFEDHRGGGHFSGRITAALVAAGGIIIPMLEKRGVRIGTHLCSLGGISDRSFTNLDEDIEILNKRSFPTLSEEAEMKMLTLAEEVRADGDSIGGVLGTAISGVPIGVGEPWFDTVEGLLAHAVFSVPAVKGIEFGLGFGFGNARGSEANDAFIFDEGRVRTRTNNNGGINGGITNGMPIIFRTAVKPTPSIKKEQDTVDIASGEECKIKIEGRHDAVIAHRAAPVITAVSALAIADLLIGRYGCDYFMDKTIK